MFLQLVRWRARGTCIRAEQQTGDNRGVSAAAAEDYLVMFAMCIAVCNLINVALHTPI